MGLFNKNPRQSSQDDFSSTNETIEGAISLVRVEANSRKSRISAIEMLAEEIYFFDTEFSDRKKLIAQLRTVHEQTARLATRVNLTTRARNSP